MASSSLTYGGRIRPGDKVLDNGWFVEVVRVKRAQGRKPAKGENLHLMADDRTIKVNSLDAVRIIPADRR